MKAIVKQGSIDFGEDNSKVYLSPKEKENLAKRDKEREVIMSDDRIMQMGIFPLPPTHTIDEWNEFRKEYRNESI